MTISLSEYRPATAVRPVSLILFSELVPVYLENLHRCLPKGTLFPVPLICTVRFGAALGRIGDESREAFLERARSAVVALA